MAKHVLRAKAVITFPTHNVVGLDKDLVITSHRRMAVTIRPTENMTGRKSPVLESYLMRSFGACGVAWHVKVQNLKRAISVQHQLEVGTVVFVVAARTAADVHHIGVPHRKNTLGNLAKADLASIE